VQRTEFKINPKLAEALNYLGFKEILLRNDKGEITEQVSAKEHIKALFTYLNMAGYLTESLIKKAVEYLAIVKPFSSETEKVISDLYQACESSHQNGKFNADYFIANFAKEEYFAADDIIDLIVFLQQTAFDRRFGEERDRLQTKPWIEEHKDEFKIAVKLGVVTPLPPLKAQYPAVGIMGAASTRVKTRLEYFRDLKIDAGHVWALSGNRELSKGLDEEKIMEKTADFVGKPVKYIKKVSGVDSREFLDGITETMMVNYLIREICPEKKMGIVDSAVESGHWRATSAQSAADIAPLFIDKIQSGTIKNTDDGQYHFLIIAEQPYPGRMARQVQREFNKVIQKRGLEGKISVTVQGCGPGLSEKDLANTQVLTRLNSELGALMAERFNDARHTLQQKAGLELRDQNIIMFSKRDETFKNYHQQSEYKPPQKSLR
jgi:hypothetical protein